MNRFDSYSPLRDYPTPWTSSINVDVPESVKGNCQSSLECMLEILMIIKKKVLLNLANKKFSKLNIYFSKISRHFGNFQDKLAFNQETRCYATG